MYRVWRDLCVFCNLINVPKNVLPKIIGKFINLYGFLLHCEIKFGILFININKIGNAIVII